MLRFGEQPARYLVDFVETPAVDGPYGARDIGEYGVIAVGSALANGLSLIAYRLSLAALEKDNHIRTAFSGVCEFPFRSDEIEMLLNDSAISKEERINQVINHLPGPVVQDIHASVAYRLFVLKNVLTDTLEAMEMNK